MSKTYLIAGASSAIAAELLPILKSEGHRCIALSTKKELMGFDESYTVERYETEHLPDLKAPLYGLIYCPGTINLGPFDRLRKDTFLSDFSINALDAALVTQKYLTNLKEGSASVVFISSVAAQIGFPYHSSVSMAKAALEGLVVALAAEFAPVIRVNAIVRSLTQTPLAKRFLATPEKLEFAKLRNPLKKVGHPADLAELAAFLLTEKSSWITGQIIAVDGGANRLKV